VFFDVRKAKALLNVLENDSVTYGDKLQVEFPPIVREEIFIPKRRNIKKGYYPDTPFAKHITEDFNPNSAPQIVERLVAKYGWEPTVLTDAGLPSAKASVLATLPYAEAVTLSRYKIIAKRISMLTGPQGWMEQVHGDGRLHTQYFSLGTVTGRSTHRPNISQVPKVLKRKVDEVDITVHGAEGFYGYECRELFGPREDWYQVGADMAGLELRCLANYLAPFDGGDYARIVCTGDPHSLTQSATGLASRNTAKTLIYAVVYGCGDFKAGTIILPDEDDTDHVRMIGKGTKKALIDGIAGFRELFAWLDSSNDGRLIGLDGRSLFVRKSYARLNTLLQSCGAILCKRWLLLCEQELVRLGLRHGHDYELLLWSHDESGHGARTLEIAEIIQAVTIEQAVRAGEYYDLRCPTAGTATIGSNWAETH